MKCAVTVEFSDHRFCAMSALISPASPEKMMDRKTKLGATSGTIKTKLGATSGTIKTKLGATSGTIKTKLGATSGTINIHQQRSALAIQIKDQAGSK